MTLEQLSNTDSTGELQAYLDLSKIVKEIMVKYAAAKDVTVAYYSKLASAAVSLAGEANVYAELEKKEFRDRVYKIVFPTLDEGLAALKELQGKTDLANHAYISYLNFMKTNPLFSQIVDIDDYETEPLGKRRSFSEECKRFTEEKIKEIYRENE